MPRAEGQKAKLLVLKQIFERKTDEEHMLSVPQLLDALEKAGMPAERKSIYSDIDALRRGGVSVPDRCAVIGFDDIAQSGWEAYRLSSMRFPVEEMIDIAVNYLPAEQPDAASLRTLLDSEGSRLTLLPGDLSDEQSCRRIVRDAVRALDGLDTLVLNAGTQHAVKEIAHLSTEQLEYTFATNVFSLFWSVQEALPHMEAGASIITTSSIQAFQPSSFLTDYAASKSAVVGFTRSLAKQLAPKGIRVNSVAPGPVWTPLQVSGAQQPENIPGFGSRTPLGRAGQPVEVAPSYVFLASEESSYITAQIIGVTGGRYIL